MSSQPQDDPPQAGLSAPAGQTGAPREGDAQSAETSTRRLDEMVERLERAAEQLRSGELSPDAAATLVEDCAALATQASNELERLARAEVSPAAPGQESLL